MGVPKATDGTQTTNQELALRIEPRLSCVKDKWGKM
jgi:hypothetical protein